MERAALRCTHHRMRTDGQWGVTARGREPNPMLCDHLEGRNSVGDARKAQEGGDIHKTYGSIMLMYGRNPHTLEQQLSSKVK